MLANHCYVINIHFIIKNVISFRRNDGVSSPEPVGPVCTSGPNTLPTPGREASIREESYS